MQRPVQNTVETFSFYQGTFVGSSFKNAAARDWAHLSFSYLEAGKILRTE